VIQVINATINKAADERVTSGTYLWQLRTGRNGSRGP
jgi:hypothetical protein